MKGILILTKNGDDNILLKTQAMLEGKMEKNV